LTEQKMYEYIQQRSTWWWYVFASAPALR
jgi:hypothetical protein